MKRAPDALRLFLLCFYVELVSGLVTRSHTGVNHEDLQLPIVSCKCNTSLPPPSACGSSCNTSLPQRHVVLASGSQAQAEVTKATQPGANSNGPLLLLFGCSLDLNALRAACSEAGSPLVFTPGTELQASMSVYYYLAHCVIRGTTMAFIFHPGASAQPYFYFYVQNGGNRSSQQIVSTSVADVVRKFGRQPTAIVVDSSLWDIASWWQHKGFPAIPYPMPYAEVNQWCQHDVPQLLLQIQTAFPASVVAFRTPPQVFGDAGFGLSSQAIDMMAGCISGKLYGKYTLIDFYAMAQPPNATLYTDNIHPGLELSLKYANAALTWVRAL